MSIQFKRSSAINMPPEPAHLVPGELAINLADKKLYTKNDKNEIINIGFNAEYAEDVFLKKTGGTLTGPVVLFEGSMPNKIDEIVSKRYVDSKFGAGSDQVLTNSQLGTTYIRKSGDTMSGKLRLEYQVTPGDDQYHATNKQFTEATYLKISGGNINGLIRSNNSLDSSAPGNALITRDFADSAYLNTAGDTMQGALSLATAPTAQNHATTKAYVDSVRTDAYPKTGGTLNGPMTATGVVTSTDASGLRIAYGSYGAMWHNNSSDFHLLFTNAGDPWGVYNSIRPFWVNIASGKVWIGAAGLEVNGAVNINAGLRAQSAVLQGNAEVNDLLIRSDKTLKKDFEPLTDALNKVCTLSASTYMKEGKTEREAGLIAQEVQDVLPEAVAELSDGKLSIYPMGIVALLVKAVQELKAEVDELKKNQK